MLTKKHMMRVQKMRRSYGEDPNSGFCDRNSQVSRGDRFTGQNESKFMVRIKPSRAKK